jgi:drug/metabolite transporter (DMT)-like permease
LLVGRRFEARELLIGLATIPGIALIVGGTPSAMNAGIAIGTLSAALAGLFATLNKRYAGCGDPLAVTGIELAAGTLFLTLMAPLLADSSVFAWPGREDAFYLVLLAYVCTLLPFAVSLLALRELSAFSTQLAVSLEPIYAICLAIVLLGEQRELSPQFYVGVVIVLLAVFSHAGLAYRGRRNLASR